MCASEGKSLGEWFGPNTIAQALKNLSVYGKANLQIQLWKYKNMDT